MTYKELDEIATKIVELELKCQETKNKTELSKYIDEIFKSADIFNKTDDIATFEQLFILDELIQEKIKKFLT